MSEPEISNTLEHRQSQTSERVWGWLLLAPGVMAVPVSFAVAAGWRWLNPDWPSESTLYWLTAVGSGAGCVWIGYVLWKLKVLTGIRSGPVQWGLVFLLTAAVNGMIAFFLLVVSSVGASLWLK